MITGQHWPWPMQPTSAALDDYFTCQCNPPPESSDQDGYLLMHRIPVDCMTAEDWQRVAREKQKRAATVWVVTSVGDSDCGGINKGLHGVYSGSVEAWTAAMAVAHEYVEDRDWDKDPEFDVTDEGTYENDDKASVHYGVDISADSGDDSAANASEEGTYNSGYDPGYDAADEGTYNDLN